MGKWRIWLTNGPGTKDDILVRYRNRSGKSITDMTDAQKKRALKKLSGRRVKVRKVVPPVFWVTGDLVGLDPDLKRALSKVGVALGRKIYIRHGFRTRAEQTRLYNAYLNGTGNLAARPGTSRHESGNAADATVSGFNLAEYPGARALCSKYGIKFPVAGEPWHAEMI